MRPLRAPRLIPRMTFITVALAALGMPASADTLLLHRRDADELVDGRGRATGGQNQRVEIWLRPDRARRSDGKSIQILRLDQKALFLLDPASKTWCRVALRGHQDRIVARTPAVFAISKEEIEIFRLKAELTPSAEPRKVGSWQAVGVTAQVANSLRPAKKVSWWTAPDLEVDDAAYKTLLRLVASLDRGGDAWLDGLLSRPGTLVLFERADILPDAEARSREELVGVEEKDPPAGIYDVPEGYRELPMKDYLRERGIPDVL